MRAWLDRFLPETVDPRPWSTRGNDVRGIPWQERAPMTAAALAGRAAAQPALDAALADVLARRDAKGARVRERDPRPGRARSAIGEINTAARAESDELIAAASLEVDNVGPPVTVYPPDAGGMVELAQIRNLWVYLPAELIAATIRRHPKWVREKARCLGLAPEETMGDVVIAWGQDQRTHAPVLQATKLAPLGKRSLGRRTTRDERGARETEVALHDDRVAKFAGTPTTPLGGALAELAYPLEGISIRDLAHVTGLAVGTVAQAFKEARVKALPRTKGAGPRERTPQLYAVRGVYRVLCALAPRMNRSTPLHDH